jgi:hypothetical protein
VRPSDRAYSIATTERQKENQPLKDDPARVAKDLERARIEQERYRWMKEGHPDHPGSRVPLAVETWEECAEFAREFEAVVRKLRNGQPVTAQGQVIGSVDDLLLGLLKQMATPPRTHSNTGPSNYSASKRHQNRHLLRRSRSEITMLVYLSRIRFQVYDQAFVQLHVESPCEITPHPRSTPPPPYGGARHRSRGGPRSPRCRSGS